MTRERFEEFVRRGQAAQAAVDGPSWLMGRAAELGVELLEGAVVAELGRVEDELRRLKRRQTILTEARRTLRAGEAPIVVAARLKSDGITLAAPPAAKV